MTLAKKHRSRALHEAAMAACDEAIALEKNRDTAAIRKYQLAWGFEMQAACAVGDLQPSRSILYRSAAWLALQGGLPNDAVRMAEVGLNAAGVPEKIADELREVLDEAVRRGGRS